MLLLLGIVACHNGDCGLRVAEIDGLMRQVRRNKDEVTGLVYDALLSPLSVTRLDAALNYIDGRLEALVAMRLGRPARGDHDLAMAARAIPNTRHHLRADRFKSASAMFIEVLPLINARAIALLDNRRLLDQLIALERRTSFGTGRDTVGHPPGSHDDLAVAVAGAVMLAGARRPKSWTGTYRCGYAPGPWMNRLGGGAMVRKPAREPLRLRTVRIAEKDMAKYGIKTLP